MKIRNLVIDALLAATIIVLKEALTFLPNIEVVTLLIMIITMTFNLSDALLITLVYVITETILYGFGIHTIPYIFVWFLIVFITYVLRKSINNYIKASILSFMFGLLFDLPFSIPFFILSVNTGISYLLNGAVCSVVHALGNFILMVLLYDVLIKKFKELHARYRL